MTGTEPMLYEIRVGGLLDDCWSSWFDGFTVTGGDAESVLRGPVVDQAALHGVLARIRDLGLPLVSVRIIARRTDLVARIDIDEREDLS
ncbi:MAG: hypothetical protein JNM77_15990 [Pseudonocardia sp.]|nr:hypothetical protein [Pseudonocardia sp.]